MKDNLEKLLFHTGDVALRRRAFWMVKKLNPGSNDRVLDAGCGDGYYLFLLNSLDLNIKLTGVDADEKALTSAAQNLKGKQIKLVNGNVSNLPFTENIFDGIVLSEVLEHLSNDIIALTEARRVLQPGGKLVVSVPHLNYPFLWDPVNWCLQRLFKSHIKRGFWAGIWNQHLRLYTKAELIKVLKDAGFKNVKVEALTHYCLPFNHYLINLVARLLARHKNNSKLINVISKFSQSKKSSRMNLFWPILFFDKLNDLWDGYGSGVSLVASATK